ncbi:MAG: DMT family transporter [Acidobacteriota bacterium]|nr:DMT family transporter [Acidobacteriota bacterium]
MTGDHLAVAVPLAVCAAACFAASNVVQSRAVRAEPPSERVDLRIVARLALRRAWLAGLAISVLGFAFQAVALGLAPVVLVQPLVVAELLFALPLAAVSNGSHLGRREWAGALLVTFGLILFVSVIHPSDPHFRASGTAWVLLTAITAAVVGALVALAVRLRGVPRTSALAASAGVCLGLMSVLTKVAAHDFAAHGVAAIGSWAPWGVAVSGLVGMSLAQNTFGAGPLAVSLPLMDLGEPLVAAVIAVTVFGERLGHLSLVGSAGLVVAASVVLAGVVLLDLSPMVQTVQADFTARTDRRGAPACPLEV